MAGTLAWYNFDIGLPTPILINDYWLFNDNNCKITSKVLISGMTQLVFEMRKSLKLQISLFYLEHWKSLLLSSPTGSEVVVKVVNYFHGSYGYSYNYFFVEVVKNSYNYFLWKVVITTV